MLVHLEGADKYYGARRVLTQVTVTVRTGAKIGVVGPNGGGKSTLLRLLAGRDGLDEGRRHTARDARVGWLGQWVAFAPEHEARTVEAYLRDGLRHVDEWATRVRALEQQLADPDVQADEARLADVMDRYAKAAIRFEQAGGYEATARMRSVAFGLGFGEDDLEKAVGTLSGGQKVRLALARLLLAEPDVLLLDEPTNHLDTETTEWLESFLQRSSRAVVVVSHDRYFLDAVTEQTWDVDGGRVTVYPAPYTRAQALKLEALQRQQALHERQQAEIARLERFVERYRAGIKARQARGRAAQLARMERIGPVEGAVYDTAAAVDGAGPGRGRRRALQGHDQGVVDGGRRGPRIGFAGVNAAGRTGREVLRMRGVAKGFDGRDVLRDVDLVAERGQRIGVIGPNGSGKTTLLRLLAGELAPDGGEIVPGAGVRIGYFAQGQEDLDPERTVADHMLEEKNLTVEQVRRHLARFLFFGDDIDALVGRLSGGERNRVALARLILREPNVLLLDEPTNHLDVAARIALEGALAEFDGTIIAVSHDRYFLESVCERLWIVSEGRVDVFVGPYSEWAEARRAAAGDLPSAGSGTGRRGKGGIRRGPGSGVRREAEPWAREQGGGGRGTPARSAAADEADDHRLRQQEARRERQRRRRRRRELTEHIAEIEQRIEALEKEQAAQTELLSDPALYGDDERARQAVLAHNETTETLSRLLEEWERLVEEAAELDAAEEDAPGT